MQVVVVYQNLHRTKDAEAAFERFMSERGGSDLTVVAAAYTAFGKYDQAFEWLERARQEQDPDLRYTKGSPLLKALEGDPRYKAFLDVTRCHSPAVPKLSQRTSLPKSGLCPTREPPFDFG